MKYLGLLFAFVLLQTHVHAEDIALVELIPHAPPDEETPNSFDIKPITVEDALTAEEIDSIVESKNFFYRDHLDANESLWNKLERKYSKQFFKKRTETYNLQGVLKAVLQDGMPIRYRIEELYRGGLGPQIALGGVLPSLSLALGDGAAPISTSNAFNGLFSFLLPQNWMNLVNKQRAYTVSKFLFMQLALDQYYATETQYITIHKLINDLEIYNFYLMHLELFTRTFPQNESPVLMVRGKMASVAGDMANTRIAVRVGLDQLAYMMAMTKDQHLRFGASKINIENLENFSEHVQNLEEINPLFAHKNDFIQEVINRSIELRAVEELYEISKLNIGITATGQILSSAGPAHGTKPEIGLNFNYQFIPLVLQATSLARTARIDVDNQLLIMVNSARLAYDNYKYNFGLYVEARRSLMINRKALKASLDNILVKGKDIDGVFLNSVIQLIDAHIKLNASVHSALNALAFMRRLMVTGEEHILNYIPVEKNINAALKLFLETYGKEEKDEEYLDNIMRTLHHKSDLKKILKGQWKDSDGNIKEFSPFAMQKAVQRNANFLLFRRWNFPKSRGFYRILKHYVDTNQLAIDENLKASLDRLSKKLFARYKAR